MEAVLSVAALAHAVGNADAFEACKLIGYKLSKSHCNHLFSLVEGMEVAQKLDRSRALAHALSAQSPCIHTV